MLTINNIMMTCQNLSEFWLTEKMLSHNYDFLTDKWNIHKISENGEQCTSQFPRLQGDVFKCPTNSSKTKEIQLTAHSLNLSADLSVLIMRQSCSQATVWTLTRIGSLLQTNQFGLNMMMIYCSGNSETLLIHFSFIFHAASVQLQLILSLVQSDYNNGGGAIMSVWVFLFL